MHKLKYILVDFFIIYFFLLCILLIRFTHIMYEEMENLKFEPNLYT